MPQSARGKSLSKSTLFIIKQHLWLKILIGMVLGIGLGILLSPEGAAIVDTDTAYTLAPWIKLPGVIFLGLIQMVIVPLVVCSIILGIADTNNLETVKRLGLRSHSGDNRNCIGAVYQPRQLYRSKLCTSCHGIGHSGQLDRGTQPIGSNHSRQAGQHDPDQPCSSLT